MKQIVRFLFVILIPLLAALLLFYGSFSLRTEANHISNEWLSLALSSNEQDRGAAFAAVDNEQHAKIFTRIEYLSVFTILLASFVCAMIIPTDLPSKPKLNLLATMVVGLGAAQLVIGFGYMNWLDFGKAAVVGSILSGLVVWFRSAAVRKPNR
tara:strand:- start:700 stop:1161 length:462 start_codon:yes stop_codon:yes gene_type:complete